MNRVWDNVRIKVLGHRQHIVIIAILLIFTYVGYQYFFKYSDVIKNPNIMKEIVLSYGNFSILVFIFLQVLQVVVFFIPGEFIQISGGYIFGTFWGGVISLIGITLGSTMVYLIAKDYGKPLVEKLMLKKEIKLFKKILDVGSKRIVVFMFYLIPGIPKDALAYICGVSNISFKDRKSVV